MTFSKISNKVVQIHGTFVKFYILMEAPQWWLIDTGFVGDFQRLKSTIDELGLRWKDLEGIFMTHGHLDHTYNLADIQRFSKCKIYGHIEDKEHFMGRYPYVGFSRVCGGLEMAGRTLFGYQPCEPDQYVKDGEILDCLGGLKAIHTPGHTKGHLSYYLLESDLLFTGDLIVNSKFRVMRPWPWLNVDEKALKQSIQKVIALGPSGMLANHCDEASPSKQLSRLLKTNF